MRNGRLLVAAVSALVAAALTGFAHDLLAWHDAVAGADRRYAARPATADWDAHTVLPADPTADLLGVHDVVALRRAVQSFVLAIDVPQGIDNGQRRARARARAELELAQVTASDDPRAASQAANLSGILAETDVAGGPTDRGRAAFEAAVLADPTNGAAAYNLELLLRRAWVVGSRVGPGSGTGFRGRAEPGAGSGRPGIGY